MRKIITIASLVVAAIGFSSVSGGSAFAAGCLYSSLPPITLSHNDLAPNQGFGYNKQAYDAQLARGNACGATTEQSLGFNQFEQSFGTDTLRSHPNEAHPSSAGSNRGR